MSLNASPRVAFVTLGCPKNESDSTRMATLVAGSAYSLTDDAHDADVVVINTCSFIRDATEESIATVMEYARDWVPARTNRKLIVAGCMPSRYGAELEDALPEPDALIPVANEDELLDVIERLTGVSQRPANAPVCQDAQPYPEVGPSAYLMISDGCHRACTYCTIPSIRGPYRSRPLDEIMAEAESLVSRGARELILIGQDITSYGRDRTDGIDLVGVVHELSGIVDLLWLRLMYAQPDGITDELLEAMSTEPKVVRYLDMPLQHSSREVLRRMGRRGDGITYLSLIERIRHAMPDVFLRTTLISGFPGETRADARALESFVRDAAFDYVGVFPFSPEEGTVAAGLGDQIPLRTRRARAQRIRDTADSVGVERCAALVGATLEVLIEGYDEEEDAIIGRHRGQAPDVDGIVTLDRGERGSVVKARIIDSLGYDLEAEVL